MFGIASHMPAPKGQELNDLILFWTECVKRRRSQLRSLEQTQNVIWDNNGRTHDHLFTWQQKWVSEARDKLQHAENVLKFLNGLR